jgi:hypothetical protein
LYFFARSLTQTERAIVINIILHAADISNATKPWTVCKPWADRVIQEFFSQGDQEKLNHLPVSPNCTREDTNQAHLNMNFGDFIVAPLYLSLRQLLPGVKRSVQCLVENRARWQQLNETTLAQQLEQTPDEAAAAQLQVEVDKWARRAETFQQSVHDVVRLGPSNSAPSLPEVRAATPSSPHRASDTPQQHSASPVSSPSASPGPFDALPTPVFIPSTEPQPMKLVDTPRSSNSAAMLPEDSMSALPAPALAHSTAGVRSLRSPSAARSSIMFLNKTLGSSSSSTKLDFSKN